MEIKNFPAKIESDINTTLNYQIQNEYELSRQRQNQIKQTTERKSITRNRVLFGILGFVFLGPLGLILGIWLGSKTGSGAKKREKLLAEEKQATDIAVENYRIQAKQQCIEYANQFEQEARDLSVKYADSSLAKDVIEWMSDGFCRTIDAADRRPHVETISVPFMFTVFANKITCNLGIYDFEIKRCANLPNPLTQTALARAIASAIQLNITMKYPQDISGTDIVTNMNYTYGEDNVTTTLTYTAKNGHYLSVSQWVE